MTGKGREALFTSPFRTFKAPPTAWILTPPSNEAQVEDTLHQFKSASSQGEGNG